MRIAHYLNQFFGGIGAEEHAGKELEIRDGAIGPAKLLESLLGNEAKVVITFVGGDNYAVEHQEELTDAVLKKLRGTKVDLFVAGPCVDAGRYGMAAGAPVPAARRGFGGARSHRHERGKSRRRSLSRLGLHHRLRN